MNRNTNRTPFVFCAFLSVATFALAGCGGGSGAPTATDATTKIAGITATDATDTTIVAASPSPDDMPCADNATGDGRPGKPGMDEEMGDEAFGSEMPVDAIKGGRPVRGAVKSVDAATLTFVLAAPPKRTDAPKPGDDAAKPAPAPDVLVVTNTDTVFVKRSGTGAAKQGAAKQGAAKTADTPATFADLSAGSRVMAQGKFDKIALTLTATRVSIAP